MSKSIVRLFAALTIACVAICTPVRSLADAIDSLAPGHWYKVPNSKLESVDPCPSGNCSYTGGNGIDHVMDGWSGAAYDTTRNRLLVSGGGHHGYFGNEVYAFDTDTLNWSRLIDPSTNVGGTESGGLYPDGTPRSRHTRNTLAYSPEIDSFLIFGAPGTNPSACCGDSKVHRLNLTGTPQWSQMANIPTNVEHRGVIAYDPNRNVIWHQGAGPGQLGKFDPATNSWTAYASEALQIYAAAALDPVRDQMLVIGGGYGGQALVWDLSTPNVDPIDLESNSTFNASNAFSLQSREAPGLAYDPVADRFVMWDGGEIVYEIHPDTFEVKRIAAAGGNTVIPTQANSNGTYGRFRYVPSRNAFMVVNNTDEDVYFYRFAPGTGSEPPPIVTLTSTPSSVESGASTTVNWTSVNATSCTASGDWSGSRPTNGNETFTNLQSDLNLTLTCSGPGGTGNDTLQVDVTTTLPPPSGDGNWDARSTAPGVLMATRFDSAADVNDWKAGSAQDHVSWETGERASGNGALRFDIYKTDGASSGNWSRWLSDDQREFDEGDEFYVQYRQFIPAYLATHRFLNGGGWKQSIISRHSADMGPAPYGSNQLNEVVLQNTNHRGLVQGYNRDLDGKYPPWDVAANTACSGTDFIYQNAIDRGVQNIGSACENDRARYGGFYSFYQQQMSGYVPGSPDPLTGAFIYYPDEWVTYMIRVKIGTYGQFNHRISVWAAREGDADYTLLIDRTDIDLGNGPKHDALWLLPYNTSRSADSSRQDTFTLYDEVVVSTQFIPAPDSTVSTNPVPAVNLTASSGSVLEGGSVVLSWSTSNADSCTASGGWSGQRPVSGSATVGPLATTSQFVLTCANAEGNGSDSVTVNVTAPPNENYDILRSSDSTHNDPTPLDGSTVAGELFAFVSPASGITQVQFFLDDTDASGTPFNVENVAPYDFQGSFSYGYDTTQVSNGDHAITALIVLSGGGTQLVTVNFNVQNQAVSPPPQLSFSATDTSIAYNGFSTLQWSSTDATSCEATGAWSGSRGVSGSYSVGPLTADSTYFLTCTGPGGGTSLAVSILVADAPAPTVSVNTSPSSVSYNGSSSLSWSTTNASSCTASGGWSGSRPVSGNETVGPLTQSTTYTLTCSGPGGSASDTANVAVAAAPLPVVNLTASPNPTDYNGGATLVWSSSNASSCTSSGDWSGSRNLAGSLTVGPLTADATYTLTCLGDGGSDGATVVVAVNPAPAPQLTLSAAPASVAYQGASVLSWSGSNINSCIASGAWAGARATAGSESTGTLTSNKTYTLTCNGPGGSIARSATVTVGAAPQPTVSLGALPETVDFGAGSQLTWASQNADSCSASGGWSGSRALNGSQAVGPLFADTDFIIVCTGAGGSATDTATVAVTPQAPSVTLTAMPDAVQFDGTTTLTWSTENADSCTASGGWSGVRAPAGSEAIPNLTADATFVLSCTGPGGQDDATAVVTVAAAGEPSLSLQATPAAVASGASATLNWVAANVDSCLASDGWSGAQAIAGSASTGALTTATSFTLTCTGPGGGINRTVIVNITTPAATVSLSAAPANVGFDGNTTLTWSSTDATSCMAFGGWSGSRAAGGSETVANLTTDTTFSLVCSGPGGDGNASTVVTVDAAQAPSVTLTAAPEQVTAGATSTLTWSSTDATVCEAVGAWSGSRAVSGSETVGPIDADSFYSLVCVGPGGQQSASVNVVVAQAAPTITINAAPQNVEYDGQTVVTWSTTDAASCDAFGAWSGSKALAGSETVGNLTKDGDFVLICTGPGGSASGSVFVAVALPTAPTVTITATPDSVAYDGSTVLTWTTENATSCTAFGSWSGDRASDGTETIEGLTLDSNFVLLCSGAGGSTARSVQVTVASPPQPEIAFSASPSSIPFGASSTLSWDVNHADDCSAAGDWSGPMEIAGTRTVGPLYSNGSYTLVCTGAAGSVSRSVSIIVGAAADMSLQDFENGSVGGTASGWYQSGTDFSIAFAPFTFLIGEQTGNQYLQAVATGNDRHAHFLQNNSTSWRDYRYTGRMYVDATTDSVGVTALSQFPAEASYYRLGYAGAGNFTLSARGTSCNGTLDTGVAATAGQWYRYSFEAESSGSSTALRARVWLEGSTEPANWQAQCQDSSPGRLLTGTAGLWASRAGAAAQVRWDDLLVTPLTVAAVPPPTLSLTATPALVQSSGFTTINWSAANADSCDAGGDWSGARGPSGSELVGPLTADSTFTLVCSGPGGSTQRTVAVAVNSSTEAPVITLSADPDSVPSGGSTTITWSALNATVCAASGDWAGIRTVSGSINLRGIDDDAVFGLTCIGPGGTTSDEIIVTLSDIPRTPELDFSVDYSLLSVTNTVQIRWESRFTEACSASGSWSGNRPISGVETAGPVSVSETYRLTCTGRGGSVAAEATVSFVDSDADGMPDVWENQFFGDLSTTGTGDSDGDGLSDQAEFAAGTNPFNIDTDGDGASDFSEVEFGSDPNDPLDTFTAGRPQQPIFDAISNMPLWGFVIDVSNGYADPDGNPLARSEWQVSLDAAFNSLVFEREVDGRTDCAVPAGVLDPGVAYFVRTRHVDSTGVPSDWSDSATVTAMTAYPNDADGDGIDDAYQAPANADANGNGTPDIDEGICNLIDAAGGSLMGVETNSGVTRCYRSVPASAIPASIEVGGELPNGLISFRVEGLFVNPANPAQVFVTIWLPNGIDPDAGWVLWDVASGEAIDYSSFVTIQGNRAVISYTDGGIGDKDGVVNGIIVDPSGPVVVAAVPPPPPPPPENPNSNKPPSDGGGGGGAPGPLALLLVALYGLCRGQRARCA